VARLSLDQLRAKAAAVIVGVVDEVSARVGSNGRMVWTDYEIAVEATLHGPDQGNRTVVSFAGGAAGGLDLGIEEMPTLEAGQRYVLFLMPQGDFASGTVGWGQGIYQVVQAEVGRRARQLLVSADGESLALNATGKLERGPAVEVIDGTLRQRPTDRAAYDLEAQAPHPVTTDAHGHPVPQPGPAAPQSLRTVAEPDFATLEDLRRFLQH
jgi:hypothetical protein